MGRQAGHPQRRDPARVAAAERLDDERVGEAGDRALVGHVDRQRLAAVVVDGVHAVDRELELVDAAARAVRVEHGAVAARLLDVVLPVARHPAEDVLRARRGLGLQLAQDLVLEVVVLEVLARHGAHDGRQAQHPARARVERPGRRGGAPTPPAAAAATSWPS